ncbi:MAG: hypothetical protein H7A51_08230 [Akkermansiaceae bacterium]|nr:hypothetical protein [Akkermansiaceae bacterium]
MPPGSIASGFTATIGLCSAEPATPAAPAKPPVTEKALAELDQAIDTVNFDDATVGDALMFLSLRTEKKFSVVCSPKSLEEERLPTIRLKNAKVSDVLKLIAVVLSDEMRTLKLETISPTVFCLKINPVVAPPAPAGCPQNAANANTTEIAVLELGGANGSNKWDAQKAEALLEKISSVCKLACPKDALDLKYHPGTGLVVAKGGRTVVEVARQSFEKLTAAKDQ